MRTDIIHIGAGELTYEIRGIMMVVEKLIEMGLDVTYENIGDPVAKGERIPDWLKELICKLTMEDDSYAYSATMGVYKTRQYLSAMNNHKNGARLDPESIIFFNGLGDAITKVYSFLRSTARVITPSPTYTTHSSSEAAHAGLPPVCYPLDPHNDWYPDIRELYRRVRYNPAVSAILIINPDNPTGMVYPKSILEDIVSIAREFDLFIIADEIYRNLIYNGHQTASLADVIGDIPGISMKGISKELPWPGSRCGWIEIYNSDKDPMFADYIKSIVNAKMVEVCSTTLPQKAIPLIFEHPAYTAFRKTRLDRYQRFSQLAHRKFKEIPGILVNQANGAFYMTVIFEEGWLNNHQSLPISNNRIRELIEGLIAETEMAPDKRFVYYLLGSTGICVVPLTSFSSDLHGFRFTLLEPDEEKFAKTIDTIADGIRQYIESA